MPVTSQHPQYVAFLPRWKKCLDFTRGAASVKAAGQTYLPKLDGHTEAEYAAYLARTKFYSATSRTVSALLGCIFRKAAVINSPVSDLDDILSNVTGQGQTFDGFAKDCAGDQIAAGRRGVLIDIPIGEANPPTPYVVAYDATQIINWRVETVDGVKKVTLVVLSEWVEVPVSGDVYARKLIQQWRVLSLVNANAGTPQAPVVMQYTQTVVQLANDIIRIDPKRSADSTFMFNAQAPDKSPAAIFVNGNAVNVNADGYVVVSATVPTREGKTLDEIPFVFLGSRDTGADVDPIPVEDLVEVNLNHYLQSAGYGHALFFCGLPTPYVFGADVGVSQFAKGEDGEMKEIKVLKVGSGTAITCKDSSAKCGYLEFSGEGLTPIKQALDDDKTEMAVLGARFLEEQKTAVETAETKRLNQGGDSSTLSTISGTLSDALTKIYYWLAYWRGQDATNATVAANMEFFDTTLDAPTLVALVQAAQGGLITAETFLFNLHRGGFLPPDVTPEDEADKLANQTPPGLRTLPPAIDPKTGKPVVTAPAPAPVPAAA